MTKKKEKETKPYHTYQIRIKQGHRMHSYFQDMAEKAKNLYNMTNFYIRQVYTALHCEGALHPLQQEAMETLASAILPMNEGQPL